MNLYFESIPNKYFYQDVDSIKINLSDYYNLVKELLPSNWQLVRSGIYIYSANTKQSSIPVQGWKIHVSSNINNAESILKVVTNYALNENLPFKFYIDKTIHSLTTEKPYPRSQSGKFITIYPKDEEQFKIAIEALYSKLKHMDGPYILSDKRYKNCKVLYYRYGAFVSINKLNNNGNLELNIFDDNGDLIPDERQPHYTKPHFVDDPFKNEVKNDSTLSKLLSLYKNIKPIRFSNSGGIYNATSKENSNEVIIKEARPYTCISLLDNMDAISYRKNEANLFNELKEYDITPKVINSFYDWEHYYLVVEKIKGTTLREYVNKYCPFSYSVVSKKEISTYLNSIIQIYIKLFSNMRKIHNEGVILSDLSLENIMVTNDFEVKFIDLESSFYLNSPPKTNMSTIKNDKLYTGNLDHKNFDYYTLGIVFYECLLQRSDLAIFNIETLLFSLQELIHDFKLPQELYDTIKKLIDTEFEKNVEDLNEIKIMLSQIVNNYSFDNFKINIANSNSSIDDYTETINVQTEKMLAHLDNPDSYIFPYTPKINNKVNLAYSSLGIRYFLNHHNNNYKFSKYDNWILKQAMNTNEISPGLFNGLAGISLTMLLSGKKNGAKRILESVKSSPLLDKSFNLFDGITGYGMLLLKFWQELDDIKYLKEAEKIGDILLERHKKDGSGNIYWVNEHKKVHIGLFYGSSGVSLFFLYLYLATKNNDYLNLGEKMLNFDLSKKTKSIKGFIGFPKENTKGSNVVPYLGYGTSGILAVLIRYFFVTNNQEYKKQIDELAETIQIKYAAFPGLFDGLAGLAYTMLDLYQFLECEEYKIATKKVIEGILLFKINIQETSFFPGDYLRKFSLDLGSGSAGISAVLDRYVNNGNNILLFNDSLIVSNNK